MKISQILKKAVPPKLSKSDLNQMKELKLLMLRYQQAAYITGKRIVIVFEGFDAAGKGSCIRHLTESLDPRSSTVIPIGAPTQEEKGQHYLQRFWRYLPSKGHLVVYDRSWYGRVLVEKVEKLASRQRIEAAYSEINQFEKLLVADGITLIKIFLAVSKKEQLERFKERLSNPLKGWKITQEDVRNRQNWLKYVKASDLMIERCPGWYVIASDSKPYARLKVLKVVTKKLSFLQKDIPLKTRKERLDSLTKALFRA
jgi:AMP-polyphosphate phosphotransferase